MMSQQQSSLSMLLLKSRLRLRRPLTTGTSSYPLQYTRSIGKQPTTPSFLPLRTATTITNITKNTIIITHRDLSTTTATATTASLCLGTPYEQLSIGIPKELYEREGRVAITPETTVRLLKAKFKNVYIEENAGRLSKFNNTAYETAGATIVPNVWNQADIILKVSDDRYIVTCDCVVV